MQNFYPLKFFNDPIKEDFVFPSNDASVVGKTKKGLGYRTFAFFNDDVESVLNTKILRWAEKFRIPITQAFIFVNDPFNEIQHTHIDTASPDELCFAINWCLKGTNSEMVWYDIKDGFTFEETVTERAMYYTSIDTEKLIIKEKHQLLGPTLVHTSIPHGIFRYSAESRISLSIRFEHNFSTWEEVVKYFSPYIIK